MRLRFSIAVITGTVLAVSSLSHATPPTQNTSVKSTSSPASSPASKTPITVEGLARVQGVLTYCAVVDSKSAVKYQQALTNIISGHSSAEIKEDQSSSRFVYALGVVDTEIAKLPVATVVSSCKNFIAGGR
jgi:hypothetical protein